jgi:hypothetical protein
MLLNMTMKKMFIETNGCEEAEYVHGKGEMILAYGLCADVKDKRIVTVVLFENNEEVTKEGRDVHPVNPALVIV